MQNRRLGSTGLSVTEIGPGTCEIGGDWGNVSEKEGCEAVTVTLDAGIDFLDTADVYGDGHSECLVRKVPEEHETDPVVAT